MSSQERQQPLDVGESDIGFQAGFGFYLGLVTTGFAAIVGLLVGASTATLLGVLPSTVTVVAIVGHILAKRTHGLPERIGRSRRRRLACYVPPATFATVLVLPVVAPIELTGRFIVVTIVVVLLTAIAAFGVDRMAQNRYVDAITADEPMATWPWHRTTYRFGHWAVTAILALAIVSGLVSAWFGNWAGLFPACYCTAILLQQHFDLGETYVDPSNRYNPPAIQLHDAGLVIDTAFTKTLVPWDAIEAIRLTDDALVVERRWVDIRCDRSAIDDPEAVYAAIETARRGATVPDV